MTHPIAPPRGLAHVTGALPRVLSGMLLMVATSCWLYSQSLSIFRGWAVLVQGLSTLFGMPVSFTMSFQGTLAAVVQAPYLVMDMQQSTLIAIALAVGCLALSFALPAARVPARYFLRVVAVVLALPACGYLLVEKPQAFDLENHMAQLFKMGYWFVLVVPLVYAVTAFILPGNLARRFPLVLLAVLFFYVSVPILALLHMHAVLLAGPAIAPALSVFFGILILSIELIAFYGLLASQE